MRIHNLQFSAPETDRKVMLVVSSIFMLMVWLAFAGFLMLALLQRPSPDAGDVEQFEVSIGYVAAWGLVFVGIPFQLARYHREWRRI
jgi:ACR3 family arsenite efflux pump ArsB